MRTVYVQDHARLISAAMLVAAPNAARLDAALAPPCLAGRGRMQPPWPGKSGILLSIQCASALLPLTAFSYM